MYSLLQKKPKLITDPYPHVVIEEALPWELYEKLEAEFPEKTLLATEPFDNGICYRMKSDVLLQPTFESTLWREFANYHTSPEWFMEVYELFKPWLEDKPKLTSLLPNLKENLGARGWAGKEINLWSDCQVVMHKPITEKTSRTAHIDNPMEMFAGLLYMPYKNDTSTGGNFQIHSTKNNIRKVDMKGGRQVYTEDLGPIHTTIPYKRNTFVMFCNANPNTVHSVSNRINPTMYRRSVNIIAEFRRHYAKMYDVEEVR